MVTMVKMVDYFGVEAPNNWFYRRYVGIRVIAPRHDPGPHFLQRPNLWYGKIGVVRSQIDEIIDSGITGVFLFVQNRSHIPAPPPSASKTPKSYISFQIFKSCLDGQVLNPGRSSVLLISGTSRLGVVKNQSNRAQIPPCVSKTLRFCFKSGLDWLLGRSAGIRFKFLNLA